MLPPQTRYFAVMKNTIWCIDTQCSKAGNINGLSAMIHIEFILLSQSCFTLHLTFKMIEGLLVSVG